MSRLRRARQFVQSLRNPWRIEVSGVENLGDGAAILVVNRVGRHDHLHVAYSIDRHTTVVLPPASGMRPILGLRRTEWTTDIDSGDHPATVLDRGEVLVVFPEGAASDDGAVHKGHAEFAALALSRKVPVVPAALVPVPGQPHGRAQLKLELRIAAPIDMTRYTELPAAGDVVDGLILRGLTDQVMAQIAELAGRRYRDSYTTSTPSRPADSERVRAREQRAERRAAAEQQRAAEAALAAELDEQEAARLAAAADAAQQHAAASAQADEQLRQQRRQAQQ